MRSTDPVARRWPRSGVAAAALLAVLLPIAKSHASTLADFTWVNYPGETGSGTLTLTLPGTITGDTFSVPTSSAAQAWADVTAFSYTFSTGISVDLGDLTSYEFTDADGQAIDAPIWATSNSSGVTGGTGDGTTDLITGFIFSGAQSLKISESLGLVTNVQAASNQINPLTGGAANDAGYWELTSLSPSPVPLPGALPLLLSGLGLFAGALRGRRRV